MIGATAPCRSRLGYGSLFFITLGGPQGHGHSLPVTARLRSRFFITLGAPQDHATPLKNMYEWGDRSLPVTARLRVVVLHHLGWAAGPWTLPAGRGSVTVEILHHLPEVVTGGDSHCDLEWRGVSGDGR
jgi:hypothetical protein